MSETFERFDHVLVVEGNSGQLRMILRDQFPKRPASLNKVEGRPFLIREVRTAIEELIDGE